MGEYLANHKEGAVQIKADIMIPPLVGNGIKITWRLTASGVIYQNIHGSESLHRLLNQIFNILHLHYITMAILCRSSGRKNLILYPQAVFIINIRHHYLHAIRSQLHRNSPADPPPGSSYNRCFSSHSQIVSHDPLLLLSTFSFPNTQKQRSDPGRSHRRFHISRFFPAPLHRHDGRSSAPFLHSAPPAVWSLPAG